MKNKIGIVGGGQLGQMMALAAIPLGFEVVVLDPTPHCPAACAARQIVGSFKDPAAILDLANQVDYLTFEIESANATVLQQLVQQGKMINPQPQALALIKDKFAQKQFCQQHGIPCASAMEINNKTEIEKAVQVFSYPMVLKARFDAYDGRGNAVLNDASDIDAALQKLGDENLYIEQFVPFAKELAMMVARAVDGTVRSYPVVESIQKDNICHTVLAPAQIDNEVAKKAQHFAEQVVRNLQGAGVFGIEMFLTNDQQVLLNEIAPRVHNSGHYTLEACVTSQFEQHIRAISGLPLGDPSMKVPAAVMVNLLGQRQGAASLQGLAAALAIDGVSVHLYGKTTTKVARKMGHITAIAADIDCTVKKAQQALQQLTI